jgi:hypothetical protein
LPRCTLRSALAVSVSMLRTRWPSSSTK